jgi:hypothetical protein
MSLKRALLTIGKIILCGLTFFVGTTLGSVVAVQLGIPAPPLPSGTDQQTLGLYMLIGSFAIAASLAAVSRGLSGGYFVRLLALAGLLWVAYSVNTYIEASIFVPAQASGFVVVTQLVGSLLCAAAVAWLFRPIVMGMTIQQRLRMFFAGRSIGQWTWRLLAALFAFPVIYAIFGMLVSPFIIKYYQQEMMGLVLPSWNKIIMVVFLRSFLFLLCCLPVLILWRKSRLGLFVTLGAALFIMVGGVPMAMAYWFPLAMRVPHGIEILADSFAHAAALVLLLVKSARVRIH